MPDDHAGAAPAIGTAAGSLLGPIGAAAGNLLGQGVDAFFQSGQNLKMREFASDMYTRQRADALSDWAMTNKYNSPVEQMKRLREGGLNPNLVYGSGTSGVSAAQPVRSSSQGSYSPRPVQFSPGSAIADFQDSQVKQATLNNLLAQNSLLIQERMLKSSQTSKTDIEAGQAGLDLDINKGLKPFTIAGREAQVGIEEARSGLLRNELEVAWQTKDANIQKAAQAVLQMRAATVQSEAQAAELRARAAKIGVDTDIQQMAADWMKQGVMPHDPIWMRKLAQLVNNF